MMNSRQKYAWSNVGDSKRTFLVFQRFMTPRVGQKYLLQCFFSYPRFRTVKFFPCEFFYPKDAVFLLWRFFTRIE
eukprot:UN14957